MPPEGIVFVVVLGFVAICSVLRNVNMLVVVSGMMLVALLLCWRVSRYAVRNVEAKRLIPNRIHVGQLTSIQWRAMNQGSYTAFRLKVVDGIRQVESRIGAPRISKKNRNLRNDGIAIFDSLLAGEHSFASYKILFAERGIYEFGPATVESQFPLALIRSWFRTRQIENIYVAPQLGVLAKNWDRIFAINNQGSTSRSNFEGIQEEEFFAIREWRSGDNLRKIHWRSSAKHRQPMVKQFDRVTEQHRAIVIDLHVDPNSSENYLQQNSNSEKALGFAATVLSHWSDGGKGSLHFAISGTEQRVFSSVRHLEFTKQCMQSLAIAKSNYGDKLGVAVARLLNSISNDVPCLIVSTRSFEEGSKDLERELHGRIRWLTIGTGEFDQIYSVENRPVEFSPEVLELA